MAPTPAPAAPLPTPPPLRRSTAATWVGATGAFLLVAAAAVFVAVRWHQLPDAAKLAVVAALTGGCLVGGRALGRTLPASGDVLFHLGAFLLPVDLAGLALRAGTGWRVLVMAEGVVGLVAMGTLAAVSGSVVLGWAAAASMVVLAVGVASVSPVPAALVLAVAAGVASVAGRRRVAAAWTGLAGLAPVIGVAAVGVVTGTRSDLGLGVLGELGLAGHGQSLLAVASGLLAAAVLGREAGARRDLRLAGLAMASLLSGAAVTWVAADLAAQAQMVAVPAGFLLVEVVAMLAQRDPFWGRPARAAGLAVETVAAVVGGAITGALVLFSPFVETGLDLFSDDPGWRPDLVAGAALGLLAAGWLVAGLRRQGGQASVWRAVVDAGTGPVAPLLALAAVACVEVATASTTATAAVLVALAGAMARSGTSVGHLVVVPLAVWAPLTAWHRPAVALFAGLVASVAVAEAAVARHRQKGLGSRVAAPLLALGAAGVALMAAGFGGQELGVGAAMTVAVFACWALAADLDRAGGAVGRAGLALGDGARAAMLVAAGIVASLAPGDAMPALAAATLLFVVDAIRLDRPWLAAGAALTVQLLIGEGGRLAGLDQAEIGFSLCVAAVVWSGLAALVDGDWHRPLLAAAAVSLVVGLPLAAPDPRLFADALLVTGGLGIAAGLVGRWPLLGHLGGAVAIAGLAGHLLAADVTALEPFVAPVALQLVVVGAQLRRSRPGAVDGDRVSSWLAYGPAIALLGGSAVAERLGGGESWHALVAGGVGVLAVACGGWRRLAGPLFAGTALLVGVTLHESLATLATVPTWAWLALGGTVLLGTGVALERTDSSPVEAGRRLVDVVGERFE